MTRIKLKISYDGTAFNGYQIQPNGRTVQEELQRALQKVHKGKTVHVTGSGRTDAGVHGAGQVVHFDTDLAIPLDRWPKALNTLLPNDVRVLEADEVSSTFHARYDVVRKSYVYRVDNDTTPNVFRRNFALHEPRTLNVSAMKEAAALLIGEHDFTSFCSARSEVKDKVRELYKIEIEVVNNEITFLFEGNGFLYNMVRILTGTLLEVGRGERGTEEVVEILKAKNRDAAGKTASPQGLYLWEVNYCN
ncbi:tRNA pseudouridine(38-40) synthase TruA [Alkalihalobacillus sp. CinArs1]|uniref:tRNA pseudouridine(38-40) synthase TruA n=1 Tax=Alkalihalobacillus sp. CinArs1 TaxID=2995314 RepID=UPI0022DD317D|nr:tRNA pseudouridine(38-40) synthase TruA [Alkalihalobacillus sp. CinArs1]